VHAASRSRPIRSRNHTGLGSNPAEGELSSGGAVTTRRPTATDQPSALAVRPDGHTAVVTGYSYGWGTLADFVTVAYNATSGQQLWVRRYGGEGNGADGAASGRGQP